MCVERITSVFSFFFLSSDEFRNKKRERGEEKIRGGGTETVSNEYAISL